jgi:hypothetical protein
LCGTKPQAPIVAKITPVSLAMVDLKPSDMPSRDCLF